MGNQDLAERISYTKKLGIIEKMPPITVLSSATEQTQSASNSGNNAAIVSQQVSSVAPFVTLPSETGSSLTQSQSVGSLETSQHDLANDIMRRKEFQNQLSQRLSQALGQRLSAQIERGSWRVEMDLHPSSLGRVEVQLEMRNGELEANFLSSNPTTRDLLQESLPRLREMLDHFGTNTAYPGMGSGYKGQSDGNPAADGSSSQRSSDEEGKSLSSDMARKPVSDDGLDVMV
jgi:flagellar hook-length control protein FliK